MLRLRVIQHWNLQRGAYSKRSSHFPLTATTQPGVTRQGDYFQLPELHRDTELVFRRSRLTPKIAFSTNSHRMAILWVKDLGGQIHHWCKSAWPVLWLWKAHLMIQTENCRRRDGTNIQISSSVMAGYVMPTSLIQVQYFISILSVCRADLATTSHLSAWMKRETADSGIGKAHVKGITFLTRFLVPFSLPQEAFS